MFSIQEHGNEETNAGTLRQVGGISLPRLPNILPDATGKGKQYGADDSHRSHKTIVSHLMISATRSQAKSATTASNQSVSPGMLSRHTLKPLASSAEPDKLLMTELDRFSQQVEGSRSRQDQGAIVEQLVRAEYKRQEPASRQTREARRRRLLAAYPEKTIAAVQQQQLQALGDVLSGPSQEEQRCAVRLQQLRQEQACILENLQLREAQCLQQQQSDMFEEQRLRDDLQRLTQHQYHAKMEAENARWRSVCDAQQAQQQAAVQQQCKDAVQDLVALATTVAEHDIRVDGRVMHQLKLQLHAAFHGGVTPEDGCSREDSEALNRALLDSYLHYSADWKLAEGSCSSTDTNRPLAEALLHTYELGARQAAGPPGPLPDLSQVGFRLAVVGPPQSGKTTVAQHVAGVLGLPVLCPRGLAEQLLQQEGDELRDAGNNEAGKQGDEAASLRKQLMATVEAGNEFSDELLVEVLLWGISQQLQQQQQQQAPRGMQTAASPSPGPAGSAQAALKRAAKQIASNKQPGFVLDGFPATAAQAYLLNHRLTGRDLPAETQLLQHRSALLAELPDRAVSKPEPAKAALDAVLCLRLDDASTIIERAVDQWLECTQKQQAALCSTALKSPCKHAAAMAPAVSEQEQRQQEHAANVHTQVVLQLQRHQQDWPQLAAALLHLAALVHKVPVDQHQDSVLAAAVDSAVASLWAKAAGMSAASAAAAAANAAKASSRAQLLMQLAQAQAEAGLAQVQATLEEAEVVTKKAPAGGKKAAGGAAAAAAPAAKAVTKSAAAAEAEAAAAAVAAAAVSLEQDRAAAKARALEHLQLCKNAGAQVEQHVQAAAEAAKAAADACEDAKTTAAVPRLIPDKMEAAEAAAIAARECSSAASDAAVQAERTLGHAKHAGETAIAKVLQYLALYSLTPRLKVAPLFEQLAAEEQRLAQQREEQQQAEQSLSKEMAADLSARWQMLEGSYVQAVVGSIRLLHQARLSALRQLRTSQQQYGAFLKRPDNAKQQLLEQLLQRFNALEPDLRSNRDSAGRLMVLAEDAREALWGLCDQRYEANEAERRKAAPESVVGEAASWAVQAAVGLLQAEVDRLLATISFVELHLMAKHRLHEIPCRLWCPSEPLLLGQPPASWPHEVRELWEGKVPLQMPEWAVPLEQRLPAVASAMRGAIAVQHLVGRTVMGADELPSGAKGGPGGKGQAGPKPKAPDPKSAAPRHPATSEQEELLRPELDRLQQRMQVLAAMARSHHEELTGAGAAVSAHLGELVTRQHQGECSAVCAAEAYLKRMAYEGRQASTSIRLAGTTFTVSAEGLAKGQQQQHQEEVAGGKAPSATTPAGGLKLAQLRCLLTAFQHVAPGGMISCSHAADIITRSAAEGLLPTEWQVLTSGQVQAALRAFDPSHSHYLHWRQLLLGLAVAGYPVVVGASSWQLSQALAAMVAADSDADGCLTREQWQGVPLWFAPADEEQSCGISNAEQQAIKELMWLLLAGYRQQAASTGSTARSASRGGSRGNSNGGSSSHSTNSSSSSSSSSSGAAQPSASGRSSELLDIWAVLQVLCMSRDALTAGTRMELLAQAAPEPLRSCISAASVGLPADWLLWHDLYIAACHHEPAAEQAVVVSPRPA